MAAGYSKGVKLKLYSMGDSVMLYLKRNSQATSKMERFFLGTWYRESRSLALPRPAR